MLRDPSDDLAVRPDWARKERPMASMLPYVSLVNEMTIRTRGNALFQCIRLDGVNSMTSDDAHLEKIGALFAAIIAQIGVTVLTDVVFVQKRRVLNRQTLPHIDKILLGEHPGETQNFAGINIRN